MLLIDKYAYNNELRDLNPQVKFLIACGGLFFFRLIDNNYLYLFNIVIMTLALVLLAKIPLKAYLDLFKLPMVFLVLSLITIVLSINNTDYLFSFNLFKWELGFTGESLIQGGKLLLTVISSLASIYFFILTTPMNSIIRLLKAFHLPDLFIELMILIYRSIFIFLDEMNNMNMAQTMKFGYENRWNSWKSTSLLIGNLFRKIIEKHQSMSIALECKLYNGEFKIGD